MRAADLQQPPEVRAEAKHHARDRLIRSLSGLAIVLGGIAFAFFRPERDVFGFAVALIGAGLLDAKSIIQAIGRK